MVLKKKFISRDECRLEALSGVALRDGRTIAIEQDPWLRAAWPSHVFGWKWVRIRYSSSIFDDPVRPLIRFMTEERKEVLHVMNGPALGQGEWVGRIPERTISVSISPVSRPGPFSFQVDSIEAVGRPELVLRAMSYDRTSLAQSVGAGIIRATEERWHTLRFGATATEMRRYPDWARRLQRNVDPAGLDRPRFDWTLAPFVCLIATLKGSARDLTRTLRSVREQTFGRWLFVGVEGKETKEGMMSQFREAQAGDSRLFLAAGQAAAIPRQVGLGDFVGLVELGDRLPPYALGCFAEEWHVVPSSEIFYGDEDSLNERTGERTGPKFKPNWDPVFFDDGARLGRLTLIRRSLFDKAVTTKPTGLLLDEEPEMLRRAARLAAPHNVHHIRRILYQSNARAPAARTAPSARILAAPTSAVGEEVGKVSIIIPTRDRPALLDGCLQSLKQQTAYSDYEVVIVDNGTTNERARKILERARSANGWQVLERPGPFNFSLLCNEGARVAKGEHLLFLNNDIVAIDRYWLDHVVHWLEMPDVGIVGAKLLFPDRTVEHAGVVIGHGGYAGHVFHRDEADDPGFLDQLIHARQVSAVTGACLGIKRSVFDQVGGFDAANFPVDLNDIDLCLRVGAAGHKCIWTPDAILYHFQSATRGVAFRPSMVYGHERQCFRKRWLHIIRDDPYFHPALSLYSHKLALA